MDEITKLAVELCEKIGSLGVGNYLNLPDEDKNH